MSNDTEITFLDAVPLMSDKELTRYVRWAHGHTDSITLRHSRAVSDEIIRRRRRSEQNR